MAVTKYKDYDFGGWATKNDLLCSDGRTIKRNAFAEQDGVKVPLVWNHDHNAPDAVCGHAILENRPEGVYAYGYFNETPSGETARELVRHGDITALSIYANKLKQAGSNVLHGSIKEVSLVMSGANPGAMIDVPLTHNDDDVTDEAIIYTGEDIMLNDQEQEIEQEEAVVEHADASEDDKTVEDVINSMTEEQKKVLYFLVAQAAQGADEESEEEVEHSDISEGEDEMKYNAFDNETESRQVLSHSDMEAIIKDAKSHGSLKEAFLAHADGDVVEPVGESTYGFNDPDMLFPDAKAMSAMPEWIKRNDDWVDIVMRETHHTPFSRVKSLFADITEDEARAKGYIKGKLKKDEVFSLLKRSTTPTTIYKKQKIDRDDVIDITDFDVVVWIKAEMRMMLNEEIARAVLFGDGRLASDDDHINEHNIRPVFNDADLFTIKHTITNQGSAAANAVEVIDGAVRARKNYKGSGNPTMFTTEDMLTEMLLLKDTHGYRIYKSIQELATAMRVSKIVPVPVMEGLKDATGNDVVAVIVNLKDYNIGADKGGAVSLFDDFDIDYNRQKYLIETRCSGALVKPYSAITVAITPAG